MRLTIIPSDNLVYIDGVALQVDCSAVVDSRHPRVPIHAIQWNGTRGEIEYVRDPLAAASECVPNRIMDDIDQFASVIVAWTKAKEIADAKVRAAVAATPMLKP
jgi:hypothetical protein